MISGVLAHLDGLAAIYLPNASSYWRIVPGAFAPFPRAWGLDTRTELRICGGDVNLSLVLAALVAADADGIRNRIDPGAPAQGDLAAPDVERLPLDWGEALDAFEASGWVKSALPFRDFSLRVIETEVEGSTKNQEAREYKAHSLLKKG